MAMYRQLPAVHPVYKVSRRLVGGRVVEGAFLMTGCLRSQLLIPHVRYTIAINTKAREELICECGIFDKVGFFFFARVLETRRKMFNRKGSE